MGRMEIDSDERLSTTSDCDADVRVSVREELTDEKESKKNVYDSDVDMLAMFSFKKSYEEVGFGLN